MYACSPIPYTGQNMDMIKYPQMCRISTADNNPAERNMYAFTEIWNEIKTQGLTQKIDPGD